VINRYRWLANTPRAHITNQRTMEVLRDLGREIEDEVYLFAAEQDLMGENVFCTSLAGEEIGRMKSWGKHPLSRAEHQLSSPTSMNDLPQTFMEPLLFKAAAWLVWGHIADGFSINLHPMGFAAWFGLIMTALNLIPIGQLDGGHIAYAVLGRRSLWVTTASATAGAVIVALYRSVTLGVFFMLAVSMLFIAGLRHPATLDDVVDLGWGRLALTVLAIVMLVLCFTPVPIEELLPH